MNFIDVAKEKKERYIVSTPGKHVFFIHNYSGTLDIEVKSPDTQVFIYGVYIGRGNIEFKLNTIQHHIVGNSVSDLLVKGVFFDESKFIYEGLIRIDKKAQKSNAYQKNQNLVMSPRVFVDSRPYLEILANDVRCTHGSTTGKLSNDQLYYAQTRGLNYQQATDMLVEGFMNDIFQRVQALGYNRADDTLQIYKARLSDF